MSIFWNLVLGGLGLGFAIFFACVGALGGWLAWGLVRGWLDRAR